LVQLKFHGSLNIEHHWSAAASRCRHRHARSVPSSAAVAVASRTGASRSSATILALNTPARPPPRAYVVRGHGLLRPARYERSIGADTAPRTLYLVVSIIVVWITTALHFRLLSSASASTRVGLAGASENRETKYSNHLAVYASTQYTAGHLRRIITTILLRSSMNRLRRGLELVEPLDSLPFLLALTAGMDCEMSVDSAMPSQSHCIDTYNHHEPYAIKCIESADRLR